MEMENLQAQQRQYQEFIEEWTHNIKTPLSLATLVLDNHKEEMSPVVQYGRHFLHSLNRYLRNLMNNRMSI